MTRTLVYPVGSRCAGALRRRLLVEPRRPAAVRASPRAHWLAVGAVCVGAFMGQLDASIVMLALPSLGHRLHVAPSAVEWVALSYLLVLIVAVMPVGWLADRVGRKLLYMHGFAVFSAGSAACAAAPSIGVLIAARCLQALGAAMLQANSVALIAEALPRRLLARGLGVQGAAQALGLAVGPAVGGALIALGGWRLVFLVNVPAGVAGLVLGWLLLPRSRASRRGVARADSSSAAQASSAQRSALGLGLGGALVAYGVLFGTLYVVPYRLASLGTGSASAGLRLAVLPVALGIAAPVAGRWTSRHGGGRPAAVGLAAAGGGLTVLALWQSGAGLLLGLALTGAGIGAFTPPNNADVMEAAPPGRTGLVAGALNMTRGLGTAVGVGVTSAVYAATAHGFGLTAAILAAAALATAAALGAASRPALG